MLKLLSTILGVTCIVWVLITTSSLAHADVTNGSFETPTVPVGSFTTFVTGSALIPGWTVVGPAVSIVSGTFTQNGVSFPAGDGNQWVDLTGFNSNAVEGVAQSVSTIPGDIYQLSYLIGNTTGGGIFGTTSTVNVSINGVPSFSDTNSAVSPTTLTWQQFTHTFPAIGSTTTLSFVNGDPASDNSNGLDAVILTDLGQGGPVGTVPEPASAVLLASGLAGLRVLSRRRSSKRVR